MPRFKLIIEYHGGPYRGWQRQDNGPSVQGAIEAALLKLGEGGLRQSEMRESAAAESAAGEDASGEDAPGQDALGQDALGQDALDEERSTGRGAARAAPLVYGAGRTDAGVHALGQVAHVDLAKDWDGFRLMEALNHHLKPAPIAIRNASRAADDFHARFDAIERRYVYRIIARRAPLTLEKGLAWRRARPLNFGAMQEAAAHLIGQHDFTTFRSAQCQAASPVKTLDELTVCAVESATLGAEEEDWEREIRVEALARSFLHNQVRSLVGTLERVGAGAWRPERVAAALQARDRAACGPVAPPQGLYLTQVLYGAQD